MAIWFILVALSKYKSYVYPSSVNWTNNLRYFCYNLFLSLTSVSLIIIRNINKNFWLCYLISKKTLKKVI